ncbi:MAG: helix-hairpin-helix domain-containing protein [Lachnospiraceae bacterium]|nr:helix-hairpin-helix domain-containing protein [Lachnospiraceae bacterium]
MKKIMRGFLFTGLLCFLVVFSGCSHPSYFQGKNNGTDAGKTKLSLGSKPKAMDKDSSLLSKETEKIYVQVAGEVTNPGVYELTKDSRVFHAIRAAGGLTKRAYDRDLNQAAPLEDGQKIYVLSRKEARGDQQPASKDVEGGTGQGSDLVNINQADESALVRLPGIGDTRAQAILGFRKEHGDFKEPEDITQVRGIGPSIFEKIKDKITVQ